MTKEQLLEKHIRKYRTGIKKDDIKEYIEAFRYILNNDNFSFGNIDLSIKQYELLNDKHFAIKPIELEKLLPKDYSNVNNNHSIHYQNYSKVLKGYEENGEFISYTPQDADDEYFQTQYLSDSELIEINNYRNQNRLNLLKRLAISEDNKYQICKNQLEKNVIESKYRESLKDRNFKAEFDKLLSKTTHSQTIMQEVNYEYKHRINSEIYDYEEEMF